MSKQIRSSKGVPIVTVAPINKKTGTGSTPKSGTGFGGSNASSAKSSFGANGKSGKSGGSTVSSSSSTFGGKNAKPASAPSNYFSGKSSKSESPSLLGGKTSSASFTTSPAKNYATSSFSTPKSTTRFGLIWIPTKKHFRKKEYVHVSHNYGDSKERSPSMYHYEAYMPGESHSHLPFKKKDEESNLLVIERPRGPIATAASAGTVIATVEATQEKSESANLDEKQELPKSNKDEEAAGDASYNKDGKDEKDFLESDTVLNKSTETWDNEKGDKVDSVYLKPPPPHKVQSRAANNDDEDCGIKCLYYTLQCCDCVLM